MPDQFAWLEDYSRVAHVVESLIHEASTGVLLSVDIGGSYFDGIASAAAEYTGNPLKRMPSLIRHLSTMNDRGAAVDVSQDAVFGRVDGRLESFNARSLLDSYALDGYDLRTQSIDSWSRGRPKLLLLHLGDTELLAGQLLGAAGVLVRDRPIVTLYPAGQDREKLVSFFADLGYRAFDLQMQSVRPDEENHASDFGWVLIADELCSAIPALPTADSGRQRSVEASFSGPESLPRQRRSRKVFGSRVSQLPELAFRLSAAEIVCCSGSYPVEKSGENSWRWLGPRPRSRLAVPCPSPGRYRVEVSAVGSSAQERISTCRVLVEGREVAISLARQQEGLIEFPAHLDFGGYKGYFDIDIVTPSFRPPVGTDLRFLRLCIASVGVSPWF